jgi:hypothetical protein
MAYMAYMAYIFCFWPTLVVKLTTFNTSCYVFATSPFPCQKSGTESDLFGDKYVQRTIMFHQLLFVESF